MTEFLRSKAPVTHCHCRLLLGEFPISGRLGPVRKLRNAKRWEQGNKVGNFSGRVILGLCACHKSGKAKVEG